MDLPLHPLVVHLPLALAIFLPFAVAAILWFSRPLPDPRRLWRLAILLQMVLALSAWAAVETGEMDEDAVEAIVPESAFETHEDRAEIFLLLAWCAVAVAAVGLVAGPVGVSARYATGALTVLLAITALGVGHAGGVLVYRHDAARVHAAGPAGTREGVAPAVNRHHRDDDDD